MNRLPFLVALPALLSAGVAVAGVPADIIDGLKSRAEEQGHVRLIVQLEEPAATGKFSPSNRAARANGIANLQQGLAQSLAQNRLGNALREVNRFRYIPFMVFTADAAGIEALGAMPQVTALQEDIPEPPALASSLPVIGAAAAWAEGFDGTGQAVAVLDSGVDTSHPFFPPAKLLAEACFSTTDTGLMPTKSWSVCPGGVEESSAAGSGQDCPSNVSGCDHGTHVAGIAVGNDGIGPNIGVGRGAGLVAIQVFSCLSNSDNCSGSGSAGSYPSDQTLALEHVLDLSDSIDIAAVNISIGSSATYSSQATCDANNTLRKAAIDNLRAVGIPTVVAAGNSNSQTGLSQPGCISSVISVGNTTDADDIAVTSNVAPFLDLLAPGSSINSSVPGGGIGSKTGTSMSSPHVAGAWAVLKQFAPSATVDEVLEALRDTGTSVDDQRSGGSVTDMRRINLDLALAALETTPVPVFESNPLPGSNLDLGDISAGGMGVAQAVAVTNSGNAALSLSCELNGADMTLFHIAQCPATVAIASSENVLVRCDPIDAGEFSTSLEITTNDPLSSLVSYTLECTGLGPELDATPSSGTPTDFGEVVVTTSSSTAEVQLHNQGSESLTVACGLTGADTGQFSVTSCPASIAAGNQATVQFQCAPQSAASFTAALEISTNDNNEPLSIYPLSCTGIEPELETDPAADSELDFSVVVVGEQSSAQDINLENTGSGSLLTMCELTGAAASSFSVTNCPSSISSGNNVDIEIRCVPVETGALTAQLQVSSNDLDEAVTLFDLVCAAVAPDIEPDPVAGSSIEFGPVYTMEFSDPSEITIENTGTSELSLSCEFQGTHPESFELLACPASIPQGNQAIVQIRCSPADEGIKLANLVLSTNDPDEPEVLFSLSCEAVDRPINVFSSGFET